jgi:hypothetical protein
MVGSSSARLLSKELQNQKNDQEDSIQVKNSKRWSSEDAVEPAIVQETRDDFDTTLLPLKGEIAR